jgi:type I restriction enzyme R subunit
LDDYVYTSDDVVIEGEVEAGEKFDEDDFNRTIEIEEREKYRVKLFMDTMDQKQKTLVFCANQGHALLVRDLINQTKESGEPDYCVRVTANDGKDGEQFLRIFQDNEKTIPTILTTSQKLSTGVDARNIRNIVLMRPINSMIEFKQIIGRGTRLYEGKDYFTIYDFVKAYEHFNDPDWDGEPADPEPVIIREGRDPGEGGGGNDRDGGDEPQPRQRIKITLADGKERTIQHMSATMFYSPDGTPMSAAQFIERLFGELPALFKDEDELRNLWGQPDTRKALLDSLAELGYGQEQFDEIKRMIDAEKSDLYDVLAYIAYALAPITRQERVDTRKEQIFGLYDDKVQAFLDFVLEQYVKEGVGELDNEKLTGLVRAKYYTMESTVKNSQRTDSI